MMKMKFTKGATPVTPADILAYVDDDGDLRIRNEHPQDNGEYNCMCLFASGGVSTSEMGFYPHCTDNREHFTKGESVTITF